MKNKKLSAWLCSFLVCLLLLTMVGCRLDDTEQTASGMTDETGVLIVDGSKTENSLPEGKFETSNQSKNKISNAKKLGGSSTLDVEYSEDETLPDDGENVIKEPQWLPGIW